MNRRSFFGAMVGGVATAAAVRTWPFRVFSFPSKVVAGQHQLAWRPTAQQLRERTNIGRGTGQVWERMPDGTPRLVRSGGRLNQYVVTDVDQVSKTITLVSLKVNKYGDWAPR